MNSMNFDQLDDIHLLEQPAEILRQQALKLYSSWKVEPGIETTNDKSLLPALEFFSCPRKSHRAV